MLAAVWGLATTTPCCGLNGTPKTHSMMVFGGGAFGRALESYRKRRTPESCTLPQEDSVRRQLSAGQEAPSAEPGSTGTPM
jgi:hypothetical protein